VINAPLAVTQAQGMAEEEEVTHSNPVLQAALTLKS
jgi:hypothetical protein